MKAEVTLELKINLNEDVSVQLNERGREIYVKYFRARRLKPPPLKKEAGGWCAFHIWELMRIFGPELHMGLPIPFVGNIIRIKT